MLNGDTQKSEKTLTIIDTFGFLFRSFYALPPFKSREGFPTGLLTGFINFIYSLGKDFETSYIIFALDSKGDSFRKEIFQAYKANRQEPPEDLSKQIPIAIEWIEKMGFKTLYKNGFEADDVICSLSKMGEQNAFKVRIISHDKDLNQLIDGNTTLFDPIKKALFTREDCFQKFGVYPENFTDYQAILGDSSDNIPGVKGIGAKGASQLLSQFSSLDELYKNINDIASKRHQTLLLESKEIAYISKELVTLRADLFEHIDFNTLVFPKENPILKIEDELRSLNITNILDKVAKEGIYVKTSSPKPKDPEEKKFQSILLNDEKALFEVIDNIPPNAIIALDTETNSLDTTKAHIIGFSFCVNNAPQKAYYVPIAHNSLMQELAQIPKATAQKALQQLLTYHIIGHNFKFDWHIISNNFEITTLPKISDTLIMAWLINPADEKSLDVLSYRYLQHTTTTFKEVVGTKGTFADTDIQQAKDYACEDAWVTLQIYTIFVQEIQPHLLKLANEVEYPFLNTLVFMENNGITIDLDFLTSFQEQTHDHIQELTKEIHALAEDTFNIKSTKQLAVILFEKLQLNASKKTKTGYSTNESALNDIIDEHPIVEKILEYRELYKLQSTYIEPLIDIASKDDEQKIHTTFVQVGTATGRLSSKNPNLQNIPVRTELGKNIRKAFIAQKDHKLIGIDYSQIELRLLAHFSQDPYLLDAFYNEQDIHLQTAIKIFGEDQAKAKRDIAKSINFGILYGMGSRKLAKMLRIETKKAKGYINSYFSSFVNVEQTLEGIKETMQQKGFVETLLNRRRYFDFANATPFEKANHLRMGVNTVFQGSAADLIKLAMNTITHRFENTETKILLQIHDEIILQTPTALAEKVADECTHIMENITPLKVPLKTSTNIGDNWFDLK